MIRIYDFKQLHIYCILHIQYKSIYLCLMGRKICREVSIDIQKMRQRERERRAVEETYIKTNF